MLGFQGPRPTRLLSGACLGARLPSLTLRFHRTTGRLDVRDSSMNLAPTMTYQTVHQTEDGPMVQTPTGVLAMLEQA